MATDYVDLGPTPAEESCQQVGTAAYDEGEARRESRIYLEQIRRVCGVEPLGARLVIKGFAHDFGTYHEVVCRFNDESETATAYAYRLEAESPQCWDSEARAQLGRDAV